MTFSVIKIISRVKLRLIGYFRKIDLNVFEDILFNKTINQNIVSYYDFDHMNRYGAKKFTDYWLKTSKNIFKNENK